MNNKIIALAAIALGAISASAQDAAPASGPSLGGSVGLAYDSRYVFRGAQFAESIIEPSVNLTYGDIYAGLWFAIPTEHPTAYVNEMDATLGYNLALSEKVKLDVGVTHYTYDEIPGNFFDGKGNTTEAYLGVVVDYSLLSPALYVFRDFDALTETVEARLGHTFDLGSGFSFALTGSAGVVFLDEGDDDNYFYYAAAANLGYAVTDKSSFSLGARAGGSDSRLIYGDIEHYESESFKKSDIWFGASFSTSF